MAQEQVGQFGINHVSILDKDGNVDEKLASGFTKEQISEMYYYLNLLRKFDEKLFNLQRSGKIGTYAQTRGQEASEIGSGLALKENDWFVPSFRELGIYLTRGTPKNLLVQAWNGDTRALGNPNHTHNLSLSIPIASQCVHATGIAWASKIKKEKDVTIVYFGEGATSEGDFHEAMNFAAVFNLPIVFFCQRNGWSISTPTNKNKWWLYLISTYNNKKKWWNMLHTDCETKLRLLAIVDGEALKEKRSELRQEYLDENLSFVPPFLVLHG